jgi:hypothetical protein
MYPGEIVYTPQSAPEKGGIHVDSDIIFPPFAGQISTHLEDTGLGGIVSYAIESAIRDVCRHARNENN